MLEAYREHVAERASLNIPPKPLSAEQQAQRKVLIQKYDTNRDGVLDNKEAKAMDKADKKALAKLAGSGVVTIDAAPSDLSVATVNKYLQLKRTARL